MSRTRKIRDRLLFIQFPLLGCGDTHNSEIYFTGSFLCKKTNRSDSFIYLGKSISKHLNVYGILKRATDWILCAAFVDFWSFKTNREGSCFTTFYNNDRICQNHRCIQCITSIYESIDFYSPLCEIHRLAYVSLPGSEPTKIVANVITFEM